MRRPAPASRPYGRSAVGLRPSLDPDASPRRAQHPGEEAERKISDPLTGPAPSGMTCEVSLRIPTRHTFGTSCAIRRRSLPPVSEWRPSVPVLHGGASRRGCSPARWPVPPRLAGRPESSDECAVLTRRASGVAAGGRRPNDRTNVLSREVGMIQRDRAVHQPNDEVRTGPGSAPSCPAARPARGDR
jgi:hypothetical protein